MGYFTRSGRFGIVGVVVVMAAVAAVALTMGQGQAKPKAALAIIFGIVVVYLVLLFFFQTRDLTRAEGADAQAIGSRPQIENPAVLDEASLWAALAIHPIDDSAIKARKQTWATARSSIHLGMVICTLIFLSVPPIYLFDTWVPFMIGAPLIALIALVKSFTLLGGGIGKAYDNASEAMGPLGLRVVEHPEVTIQPKGVAPLRMGPVMHGQLLMQGERHGRDVTVRMPTSAGARSPSQVTVSMPAPAFEFKSRDGRVKAAKGAPPAAAEALASVPNSPRWNGVRGQADGEGIVVARKSSKSGDWMLDLWLAERLADAVAAR